MRPSRETFRQADQTYFATFQTAHRQCFFRNERWTKLFLETLASYQDQLHLHDFVIMHDHVHLLLSPTVPLERAVQLMKGGFSFRARKEFNWKGDIWQAGFTDHRIRDNEDFENHLRYIQKNASSLRSEFPYTAERSDFSLAPLPPWLKPPDVGADNGGAKAPPLQSAIIALHEADRDDIYHAKDADDLFRKLGI